METGRIINVTINKDEKTCTSDEGDLFTIGGLIIKKPNGMPDVFYGSETTLCKAIVFRGLKMSAKYHRDNRVHLL
jgi:hypothetical protein